MINIINPEFQRNVWKEFSLHRLIAMPLVLALIFYLSYVEPQFLGHIPELAIKIMLFLLVVWGTGLTADAVFEEIQEHTWETQRMTPLSAWSMTWGKLFGTSSYVWYGTGITTIVYLLAQISFPASHNTLFYNFSRPLFDFIYCIFTGLAAQAFALFSALLIQRISPRRSRAKVALIQLFTIVVFLSLYGFGFSGLPYFYKSSSWYGLNISYPIFVLTSQLFLIFWLYVGIYRLLKVELQIKTLPWVWPLFVVVWVLYCLGLVYLPDRLIDDQFFSLILPAWRWGVAYFFILNLTFLAAFFAPKNIIHAYRWFMFLKQGNVREMLGLTPVWIFSFVLAAFSLIPLIYYIHQGAVVEGKMINLQSIGFALSLPLFLLRDIGLLYFLCWNPKAKRGHMATILYLIILYVFIPLLLPLMGLPKFLLPAFAPAAWFTQTDVNASQIALIIGLVMLEAALMCYAVWYRWQQNQVPKETSSKGA